MTVSDSFMQVASTGLLAAVISAVVAKASSDKAHRLEYITKERERWRRDIRQLVVDVNEAFESPWQRGTRLRVLCAKLQVRLNPDDPLDEEILCVLNELIENSCRKALSAFNEQMARLLKYDWERAKFEASGTFPPWKVVLFGLVAIGISLLVVEVGYNWREPEFDWSLLVWRSGFLAVAFLLINIYKQTWGRLHRLAFPDEGTPGHGEHTGDETKGCRRRSLRRFFYVLHLWWLQETPPLIRDRGRRKPGDCP